jgi:hypothetical protein
VVLALPPHLALRHPPKLGVDQLDKPTFGLLGRRKGSVAACGTALQLALYAPVDWLDFCEEGNPNAAVMLRAHPATI